MSTSAREAASAGNPTGKCRACCRWPGAETAVDSHDDIYQAVLQICRDATHLMSQSAVNDLAQSGWAYLIARRAMSSPVTTGLSSRNSSGGTACSRSRVRENHSGVRQIHACGLFGRGLALPAREQAEDKRSGSVPEALADTPTRAVERSGDSADDETRGVRAAYREYATAQHDLVEMEDRTSEAVASAGFDLIGWRQPVMTTGWTVDAFAYRVVESAASLDVRLADEMRASFAAVRSYLRAKPALKA